MKIQGVNPKVSLYEAIENRKNKDFGKMLLEALREVDKKEMEAEEALFSLAKGEDIDPAEVAMKISSADASLKLLLRIRNKALEAYQEIMRMQI